MYPVSKMITIDFCKDILYAHCGHSLKQHFYNGGIYLPGSEDFLHALDVLLKVQFDMYRQILKNGYTESQAHNCMKIMMKFMNGGWSTVMQEFLDEKGEGNQ